MQDRFVAAIYICLGIGTKGRKMEGKKNDWGN